MLARLNTYPQRTPEERKERAREMMASWRRFCAAVKQTEGCIDCGYNEHPAALHLDHCSQSTKKFKMKGAGMRKAESLIDELMKCDTRCANCHAISHALDCKLERGEF